MLCIFCGQWYQRDHRATPAGLTGIIAICICAKPLCQIEAHGTRAEKLDIVQAALSLAEPFGSWLHD